MLFDAEIIRYCEQHVNFETFPYHRAGAVLAVHDKQRLSEVISQSLQSTVQQEVWSRAHENLTDPATAPQLALDAIANFLARNRQ